MRPSGNTIVRKDARRRLSYSDLSSTDYLGHYDHLLSANLNGELVLGMSCYEPGCSSGDDCYSHKGEEAGFRAVRLPRTQYRRSGLSPERGRQLFFSKLGASPLRQSGRRRGHGGDLGQHTNHAAAVEHVVFR